MNETIQIIFEGTPPFDLAPVLVLFAAFPKLKLTTSVTNFVNGNRTDQGCYVGQAWTLGNDLPLILLVWIYEYDFDYKHL